MFPKSVGSAAFPKLNYRNDYVGTVWDQTSGDVTVELDKSMCDNLLGIQVLCCSFSLE